MKIFESISEWQKIRQTFTGDMTVGFVPTMGNLHHGHASLYNISRAENTCTVASIFVNPTQFNQQADFIHYPRTLEADLDLLRRIGVDYCLLPTEPMMYPDGYRYQVLENQQSLLLEGEHRPGHFTGVLTIVMKLLNLVKPHRAYFGEKDFQQFQLIHDMATAFFMDIDIKCCPTIREDSKLAFSSRNNRLTKEQRHTAVQFAAIFNQPHLNIEIIRQQLQTLGINIQYLKEHDKRRFIAVDVGEIRLIDNYAIPTR